MKDILPKISIRIQFIAVFLIVAILSYQQLLQQTYFFELYFQYAPNKYRLQIQLMLFLSSKIFNYYIWEIIFYLISFSIILYLIYNELAINKRMYYNFMALNFMIIFLPLHLLHYTIAYVLIVIAIKFDNKYLLIPLTVIREHTSWILLGYFIIKEKRINRTLIVSSGLSVLTYVLMRYVIIGDAPYFFNEFFFPYKLFQDSRIAPTLIDQAVRMIPLTIFGMLFFVRKKEHILLILWNTLPLLLFSLIWETQLWYPIFLIITTRNEFDDRKKSKEKKDINLRQGQITKSGTGQSQMNKVGL